MNCWPSVPRSRVISYLTCILCNFALQLQRRCATHLGFVVLALPFVSCAETSQTTPEIAAPDQSGPEDLEKFGGYDTSADVSDSQPTPDLMTRHEVGPHDVTMDAEFAPEVLNEVDHAGLSDTGDGRSGMDADKPIDVHRSGTCETHADCDDANHCTIDTCLITNSCAWEYVLCDDDSLCTLDGCEPTTGCVFMEVACTSADPCQIATCSETTGQCAISPVDCDDDNPCTVDGCVPASGCYHEENPVKPCCETDNDCPKAPCTLGSCVAGVCHEAAKPLPECCSPVVGSETFDDGIANGFVWSNTTDAAKWSIYPGGPISTSPCLYFGNLTTLTYQGGPWEDSVLSGEIVLPTQSQSTLRFDLNMATESSPQFDVLVVDILDNTGASHRVWTKKFDLTNTFSWNNHEIDLTPLAGSTIQIKWTFSTIDNNANMGFGVFLDNIQITSSCSEKPCTNAKNCVSAIPAYVGTCVDQNCMFSANPALCTTESECVATSPCGQTVCQDGYCGVVHSAGCCVDATDCTDGDPCTTDICVQSTGQCANPSSWLCCYVDADCDDGNPCTTDGCPAPLTLCTHIAKTDCCRGVGDCEKPSDCAEWSCTLNQCTKLASCCDTDGNCDDGKPCTTETCINGQCNYTPTDPASPCCDPVIFEDEFSTLKAGTWSTVVDSADTDDMMWHITSDAFLSPPSALALASKSTGTYESSVPVHLVLESTPLAIPAKAMLSFWFSLSNEYSNGASAAIAYDVLSIIVVDGAQQKVLWSSSQPKAPWWNVGGVSGIAGPKWSYVGDLSLAPYAAKTVSFRISFVTFDSAHNEFFGPVVDDFKVEAPCAK